MPGASEGYHAARAAVLDAEVELRDHVERVAALRAGQRPLLVVLPQGPVLDQRLDVLLALRSSRVCAKVM